MYAIEWDKVGEHFFETGCDHGVLYPQVGGAYPKGVAWNGLTNVNTNPSGGESTKLYADNIPYLTLRSAEEFGLTIECYFYPDEFKACDGSTELMPGISVGQQTRMNFGLCYRTLIGNDTENTKHGFKLHLVYGCSVSPSTKESSTINDSPDATTLSFEATTNPVNITGAEPASELVIDSTKVSEEAMEAIMSVLYGTAKVGDTPAVNPRLPLPDEIAQIAAAADAA